MFRLDPLIVLKRPRVQSAHPVKIGVQLWWKLQRKVICGIIYSSIGSKSVKISKIFLAYSFQLKTDFDISNESRVVLNKINLKQTLLTTYFGGSTSVFNKNFTCIGSAVAHKWRHANYVSFWDPFSSLVTFFTGLNFVLTKYLNSWPLRMWRHLWMSPKGLLVGKVSHSPLASLDG